MNLEKKDSITKPVYVMQTLMDCTRHRRKNAMEVFNIYTV